MNRVGRIRGLVVALALAAVLLPKSAAGQSVYEAIDQALSACASMVVSGGTRAAMVEHLRSAGYVIAGGEFRLRRDWGLLMITSANSAGCFVNLPEMNPEQALGLTKIFVAGLGTGWEAGLVDQPWEAGGATYRVSDWQGPSAKIGFTRDPDGRTHVSFRTSSSAVAAAPPGTAGLVTRRLHAPGAR
jgi:hypothetical protein